MYHRQITCTGCVKHPNRPSTKGASLSRLQATNGLASLQNASQCVHGHTCTQPVLRQGKPQPQIAEARHGPPPWCAGPSCCSLGACGTGTVLLLNRRGYARDAHAGTADSVACPKNTAWPRAPTTSTGMAWHMSCARHATTQGHQGLAISSSCSDEAARWRRSCSASSPAHQRCPATPPQEGQGPGSATPAPPPQTTHPCQVPPRRRSTS